MKKTYNRLNRILSIILVCVMISQTCFSSVIYGADLESGNVSVENNVVDETTESTHQSSETDGQEQQEQVQKAEQSESEQSEPESEQTGETSEEAEELSADNTEDTAVPSEAEELFTDEASELTSEETDAGKLTLTENEKKELTLTEDKTFTGIELVQGSELTVNTNNHSFTVNGDITGDGKVTLKGKNIRISNLSVQTLVIEEAEVTAGDTDEDNMGKIQAADSLTVRNSKVSNAAFLGYGENASGEKTLAFEGSNELRNITQIGTAENGNAIVLLTGASSISTVTNSNFCCDYKFTYTSGNKTLAPKENWPVSYRVKYTGNMNVSSGTVCGFHKAGSDENADASYQSAQEITLPSYAEEGYIYNGWIIGDKTETITAISGSQAGEINLKVSMTAAQVVLTTDLGYTPAADTNDDYDKIQKQTTTETSWGESVSLTEPTRFGYQFDGWKVIKGSEDENNDAARYKKSYQAALEDAEKTESGSYTIFLRAQWSAKNFSFRFFIKDVDSSQMQVKVGTETYESVQKFAEKYPNITWNENSSQLEFPDIRYNETLSEYISRVGLSEIPVLEDTRTGDQKQEFRGWTTPGGKKITADMKFAIGEILDNRSASVTLADYEKSIHSTPVFLTSAWGTSEYILKVEPASGWELLVNEEVQDLDTTKTAELKVSAGSKITFRCSALNPENFSLWDFTEGFLPEETAYTAGAKYLSYETVMPYNDVTASYNNDLSKAYIDIAQGSVIFEQDVALPSGRKADGFWYPAVMNGTIYKDSTESEIYVNAMTPVFQQNENSSEHAGEYFYIWDSKNPFRITTQQKETKNQIILTNELKVYLRDCNMTAREAYKKAAGTKFDGVELESLVGANTGGTMVKNLAEKNFRECGNIVADTAQNSHYALIFYVEGNGNRIANITTDGFHAQNEYGGSIKIQSGDNTKKDIQLGTVFGDFSINMQHLNIKPYEDGFEYLIYTASTGAPYINSCTINAQNKSIFTFARGIQITGSSVVEIGELKCYYEGVKFGGTSYTHVHRDIYSNRHGVVMSDNASAVIDGNVITTAQDNYSSGKISTTGYLIVKGTVFDASNLTVEKGTVICNVFQAGESFTISGSAVLIANMITSNIYNRVDYDEESKCYKPSAGGTANIETLTPEKEILNEDDYPFTVYSGNIQSEKVFTFEGKAKVYLLGHYKTSTGNSGKNYYDLTVKATDGDNPVSEYIAQCLDTNGDLKSGINVNIDESAIKNTDSNRECIMLGNSTYTAQTSMPRSIAVKGAEIYAAGNITFFNDTTVTGGKIVCSGSLGSKLDLNINGGEIKADKVGNVYDLTSVNSDKTKTWKKTSVTGGTIEADVIGARESYGSKGTVQRSLVEISGGTIKENSTVRSDEYINYIYDTSVFPEDQNQFAALQDNIRFEGKYESEDVKNWTTEGISDIAKPKLSDGKEGEWSYDSLAGRNITGISKDGTILPKGDNEDSISVQGKDCLRLYAVKKQYTLTRVYGDSYYNISARNQGETAAANWITGTVTDLNDLNKLNVSQATVDTGAEITLEITADNSDYYQARTVVWYIDANGQYHNALNGCKWNDKTVTFPMPKGNCYIYVVDDDHTLPLDLNAGGLSFTKDGFITEFADSNGNGSLSVQNEDTVFTYAGNYRIVQSNIGVNEIKDAGNKDYPMLTVNDAKKTGNRIIFASDFENTGDGGQKITVSRVFQKCQDAEFGTLLENNSTSKSGAKVRMELDGKSAFFRFQIKENCSLTLEGKNRLDESGVPNDTIYITKGVSNSPDTYLTLAGNNNGKTGDLTLEKLNIDMLNGYSGFIMRAMNDKDKSGSLTMRSCKIKKAWGDSTGLARNLDTVTLENCDIDITTNAGYTTAMFLGCENVTICKKSKIQWKNIGSTNTGGFSADYGISNTLTVDDSELITAFDPKANEGTCLINPSSVNQAKKVILQNNASYTADSLAYFNGLQVSSGAKLNVKQQEAGSEETWLFCKDILVDGGSITADNVILSGFYEHKNYDKSAAYKAALDSAISNKTDMVDGNSCTGLKITSGSVNASKFVGGDCNGKIEVSGGVLKASAIGTSGYLYGFVRQLPGNKTDYAYRYPILDYSNYTESAIVTVKDSGTVQVSENGYLGGMRCKVDVQGGNVMLGNHSVLGMTEEQKKDLEDYYSSRGDDIRKHTDTNCKVTASGGSIELETAAGSENAEGDIRVPYGVIEFSETAKAKVTNILSENGTIQISKTAKGYENPYQGGESSSFKKATVAIWVLNTLSAQTLEITDGAQVYAENAYAVVEQTDDGSYTGKLRVSEAGLYAASYGEKGVSRENNEKNYNDKSNDPSQTVFGTRLVTVTYVLNPQGIISDDDLETVVNDSPENYTVTSEEKTLALTNAQCRGYHFCGWYSTSDCTGDKAESLNTSIANDLKLYAKWEKIKVKFQVMMDKDSSGYYAETEFADNENWKKGEDSYVSAKSVELAYGEKILSVSGVNLMDYITNTLGITELEIKEADYAGNKVINTDSSVSRDLAEYYKDKAGKDSSAVIILHVKNVQKRIASVTFDVNKKEGKPADAAFADGKTSMQANISVDKAIGSVSGFGDSADSELVKPSATGYTFIGWNTEKNAEKDTTNGWVNAADTFKADTTVYAIWQANTYLVQFDAGDGNWVTVGNTEPEVGSGTVKNLSYYWVYDTPVSENHSFWLKLNGTDEYMTEMPYAWREGYVFDHNKSWTYTYTEKGEEKKGVIESTEELSKIAVRALNTALGDSNGNPTQVALTITASYTPVKVTYKLNGGKWQKEDLADEATPEYGKALAGYVKADSSSTDSTGTEELKTTESTGADGNSYYVASTTNEYYSKNKKYVSNDYRHVLQRKGYTFYGWYTSQDDAERAVEAGNSEDTTASSSVGTTPRFRNVTLYAAWKANTYTLKVNNKDVNKTYSYTDFKVPSTDSSSGETTENGASYVEIFATTGQEITDDKWPSRESGKAWYIHNIGETENVNTSKRYFLGATFMALDPGSASSAEGDAGKDTYDSYAKTLTTMENSGTLYMGKTGNADGSVLTFPEDSDYRKDLEGISTASEYTIPDYPEGSTIDMYAVYREQSIVFIERYVDKDGNEQQKIMHTASWDEWSDYPEKYGSGDTKITSGGYSLIGWYVNSTTANEADRYPAGDETYKKNLYSYIKKAAENNTYDIMVYTVYTPQIKREVILDAKQDPTSTAVSSDSYTLPASMQTGILHMELYGDDLSKLKFVSKKQMEDHQYDQIWKDGNEEYTSDNTVAVQVTVSSSGKLDTVKELSEYAGEKLGFENLQVGAGDQITLTLYHSRVMTQEKTYSFTLKTCFTDNVSETNSLENQYVSNLVTVNLKPSLYKVNYTIQLPEELDKLTIQKKEDNSENWGDFDRPEETETSPITTVVKQATTGYGSSLLNVLPSVEGYTPDAGWKISGDQETDSSAKAAEYTELKMPVSEANKGVIDLSAGYTVQSYDLSADGDVLKYWKITYSNRPDADKTDTNKWNELKEDESGSDSAENTVSAKVNYHSVIIFEPRDKSKADPSEFVTLKMMNTADGADIVQKTVKLPDYAAAGQDDTYSFVMPAINVAGSYITTETMYLDEGTISITEQGYTQNKSEGKVTKTWRGNYTILQNAENDAAKATENRLLLSGNLSSREISLGNLNISSGNSVELQTGDSSVSTKAVLTLKDNSTVTAKNIKVPSDAEISIAGTDQTQDGAVKLFPDKTTSAIGGAQDAEASGNGKITLENIKLELSMPAGSDASAIGSAKRDSAKSGNISLSSCEVTVTEGSTTETYKGAWIGGDNTENVTLKGTSLQAKNDNHMAGPVITTGKNVTVDECKIGTVGKNVTDPVYAAEQLAIKDSSIYINIQDNISTQTASSPVGTTTNGTVKISNSTIKAAKSGGTAQIAGLYSGTMKIQDAASNVMIDGTQILEVSNGAISINGNQYQQSTEEHISDASRKNYILLEENAENKALITDPDFTVTEMPVNGTIEIGQPSDTSVQEVIIGNLQVQTNTTMILKGNLKVTGTAILRTTDSDTLTATAEKSAITLNVRAEDENGTDDSENRYGITFSGDAENSVFLKSAGNHYIQSGGKLECENCDLSDGSLNITLNQVSASVKNFYAKNLTVDGGTVKAENEGKVGSKPENGSEATSVKISKASVTAAEIGALGDYDQTFTSVTLENPTLNGNLVQDHYRLKYDTGRGKELNTELLNHVFRTETTYGENGSSNTSVITGPGNGIPGDPTAETENAKALFGIWYINCKGNNETDTEAAATVRKALAADNKKLPAGLKERTVLAVETLTQVNANDVITNADGTKTLTVHAWLNASGTTSITKGRVFQAFDSSSNNTEISVQKNGAWTAMLTSTGTSIEGRDYKVTFSKALPQGTTLTLTEPSADSEAGNYYYYKVMQENISSVKFTEFTAMGGTEKFKTVTETENVPENETFLLSVDFENAAAESGEQSAEFKLIPSDDSSSTDEISMGEKLTYSLTDVKAGELSVSGETVTIKSLPKDPDKLTGKNLFMKAVIKNQNSNDSTIPYGISAGWNEKAGTWISHDTVLFDLGSYSEVEGMQPLSGAMKFEGLENGTYQISCSLVYGTDENAANIAGNVISNVENLTYTENHIEPSLTVTPDTASRVLESGTETKVTFTYKAAAPAEVAVTAEKQNALCEFKTMDSTEGITIVSNDPKSDTGGAVVCFGENLNPGTYRICFSMDKDSSEDNVYITFIVK